VSNAVSNNFLMTPAQHRRRAEQLRASRPELAKHHDQLAKAIEKRRSAAALVTLKST
jgi:hypothetical protein